MAGEDLELTELERLEQKYASPRPEEPKPEPGESDDGERYYEPVKKGSGRGTKALRVVLWVAAVVGGFAVAQVYWQGLEASGLHGDSSQRWFALGALALLALGVFALLASYRGRDRREGLVVPAAAVAISLAILAAVVYESRGNNDQLVGNYCSYGSRSIAQYVECVRHVTPGEVVYSNTPAADFANGKTSECGAGSGPYCGEAASRHEARQALAEHEREP